MQKKPAKYGLKIKYLTDAISSYFYNRYLYRGAGSDGIGLNAEEKQLSIPTQSVLQLSNILKHTLRNITADNRFSSVEFCRELAK